MIKAILIGVIAVSLGGYGLLAFEYGQRKQEAAQYEN